jgi:hypothetical protein
MPAMKMRLIIPVVSSLCAGPITGLSIGQAFAAPAAAPAAKAVSPAEEVDMTPVKDKMTLVTDGKGHYMAYAPLEQMSDFLFYGDGKKFYQQRVFGGGSEGTIAFSRHFWEPRSNHGRGASFEFRSKKYNVECGERKTELTVVPEAEAKPLVAAAKWLKPRWKHRAYLLARDEMAKYYYVDKMREPENNSNFRLYVGPKGNLKLQKMTNVVSDTQGDIFATKTGSLRLIAGQTESSWVQGTKKTKLTPVPVEDNAMMIYTDLGVYAGEALGTPCDDL